MREDDSSRRRTRSPSAVSRYDLVLAAIPSAFIAALLVGNLLSIPAQTALAAAAAVEALVLVDALFLNPPQQGGTDGKFAWKWISSARRPNASSSD